MPEALCPLQLRGINSILMRLSDLTVFFQTYNKRFKLPVIAGFEQKFDKRSSLAVSLHHFNL